MREGAGGDRSRVRGGRRRTGDGAERGDGAAGERCEAGRGREAGGAREAVGELDPCLGSRSPIFGKVEFLGPNLEELFLGVPFGICTYCACNASGKQALFGKQALCLALHTAACCAMLAYTGRDLI